MDHISKHTINFIQALAKNNNRKWFQANKADYERSLEEVRAFGDEIIAEVSTFDMIDTPSGKKSIYRIYRDVRFSKNKVPYKTHWAGSLKRSGASRRGGMYYHLEPGNSFVAGGFWAPHKDDLLLIRKQIEADADPLRKVLSSKGFKDNFGELQGEQLKTSPKGFDKEHKNIDLLRFKQFLCYKKFSDKEMMSPGFVNKVAAAFEAMLPFLDVMTEYLTTDLNGVSTIEEA
ncbi:MAG: DUF2461 domain-containing protein [Bacteroidia bacterium]